MGDGHDELQSLSRAELVQRASALGVDRPERLTRPELIDEIVSASIRDENERSQARGLLGRARDLVARVVEKGLHLPDAAQRLRTLTPQTQQPRLPTPIPTVALAHVYANQGHRRQAIRVLDEVLGADPANEAALTFRAELEGAGAPARSAEEPTAVSAPELEAPQEAPATGERPVVGKPEVPTLDSVSVVRSATRVRITWRVRPATFARSRTRWPAGRLVLRLVHASATEEGPELATRDIEVDRLAGSRDVDLPDEAVSSHVALGWRDGVTFVVLATEAGARD